MAQTELTCDTLGDLDGGRSRGIINAALRRIMDDLDDRGEEDEKVRALDLKITFVIKKGNLAVEIQADAKLPKYRSNETIAKLTQKAKRNGTGGVRNAIEFQEHNAENPDQSTFGAMDRVDADNGN
jgi:hypothetical protein